MILEQVNLLDDVTLSGTITKNACLWFEPLHIASLVHYPSKPTVIDSLQEGHYNQSVFVPIRVPSFK